MKILILGQNEINKDIESCFSAYGYSAVVIDDVSGIKSFNGQIGDFHVKTADGDVDASIVVITEPMRAIWNNYRHNLQQVDDATLYRTRRQVEDTARAMQANYVADVLTWEQYKDSDSQEQRGWASNARMRANRTASNFNNFMRENNFVWSYGIPYDIDEDLPFLE